MAASVVVGPLVHRSTKQAELAELAVPRVTEATAVPGRSPALRELTAPVAKAAKAETGIREVMERTPLSVPRPAQAPTVGLEAQEALGGPRRQGRQVVLAKAGLVETAETAETAVAGSHRMPTRRPRPEEMPVPVVPVGQAGQRAPVSVATAAMVDRVASLAMPEWRPEEARVPQAATEAQAELGATAVVAA